MEKTPVLCVAGPTASGKTALAVRLAKRLDGEIVNMDSMQIYRRMDIGTAKPTPEEREGIPHHLLDIVEPTESFSVAEYAQRAETCHREIVGRGKLPILVGGTGFYLRALTDGLHLGSMPSDPSSTLMFWSARKFRPSKLPSSGSMNRSFAGFLTSTMVSNMVREPSWMN